jgi:hypothetical protein
MPQIKEFHTPSRREKAMVRNLMVVVIVLALAGVAALVVTENKKRSDAIAESSAAANVEALVGPPCPAVTAEAFAARGVKTPKVFEFNNDQYARRFGHADCNLVAVKGVRDPVPVCQFTGPSLITVTTEKGVFHFDPGTGSPATTRVVDGTPSCVKVANFKG